MIGSGCVDGMEQIREGEVVGGGGQFDMSEKSWVMEYLGGLRDVVEECFDEVFQEDYGGVLVIYDFEKECLVDKVMVDCVVNQQG